MHNRIQRYESVYTNGYLHPSRNTSNLQISGRWLDQQGIRNNTQPNTIPHRDNKDNYHIRNKYVHTNLEVHANLKNQIQTRKAYVHKTNKLHIQIQKIETPNIKTNSLKPSNNSIKITLPLFVIIKKGRLLTQRPLALVLMITKHM